MHSKIHWSLYAIALSLALGASAVVNAFGYHPSGWNKSRPGAAGGCWVSGQRYADCGNGTVTDSTTGLIWLKDAACASLGTVDYAEANTEAGELHSGECGLSDGSVRGDWRLPTREEWLETLAGPQGFIAQYDPTTCLHPALRANDGTTCYSAAAQGTGADQHAFLNVVSGGYWASST